MEAEPVKPSKKAEAVLAARMADRQRTIEEISRRPGSDPNVAKAYRMPGSRKCK